MKDFTVTVELMFSVQAGTEEKAQERAQEVVDTLEVKHPPAKWLGDVEIGEPEVEED